MTPQQRNHPRLESMIAVEPLRALEDVTLVRNSLTGRDRVLFTLGVNTNLRAGDLLNLKVSNLDFNQARIMVRERKTGKPRHIDISPEVMTLLNVYRTTSPNVLLFPSRKGGGVMTVSSLNHMVKKWCSDVGLPGNFGSHTLRKTWAFVQYKLFGTDVVVISRELNHSSMDVTYRYLGITPDEVKAAYMRFI